MQTVLFIDPVCPKPYDLNNLMGLGATEAVTCRVAEGLAQKGYIVSLAQHNRPIPHQSLSGVWYATNEHAVSRPDHVVILRNATLIQETRVKYPDAKIYLWCHDTTTRDVGAQFAQGMFKGLTKQICVSSWHRTQTVEVLRAYGYTGQHKVRFVYNPVYSDLAKPSNDYSKDLLCFISSPHKGLDHTLNLFSLIHAKFPSTTLYVCNPGYLENRVKDYPGVVWKGTQSHEDTLKLLSQSMCLFYPNTVFPETFGNVLAEANNLGVPVLTHRMGAASEVLDSHPDQFVDCRDAEAVVKRIEKWYNGARPIVRGKAAFKTNNVINQWISLFNDSR